MIADYSSEIRIVIFQSFWNASVPIEGQLSNCSPVAATIARFNSEIIPQKLAKFVYDVAGLLPFNLLKAAS